MQVRELKRGALWVLATVILGALGSGLWDIGIRPGGQWCWHALLTTVTLGSKVLKDQVYLEAAKGDHEGAARLSVTVLGWLFGAGSGIVLASMTYILGERKARESGTSRSISFLARLGGHRATVWSVILFTIFLTVLFNIQSVKISASNQAYTYFQQSLTICQPYLSEHQAQMFKSRFAALQSRDEYIAIMNDLKQVAASNHLNLPNFNPW